MDMGEVVRGQVINKAMTQKAAQLSMEAQTEIIRQGLGFGSAPVLEQILIENIIVSWLRLQWVELQITGHMGSQSSMPEVLFLERRLTISQQRFLRASNALAKVRKLTRGTVQINIASDGGQQVNVAGNIRKERS